MTYSASRLTLYAVISSIEDDLRRALLFHLSAEGNAKSILGDVLYARSVERYLKEHEGGSDEIGRASCRERV